MIFLTIFSVICIAQSREANWKLERVIYRLPGETAVFKCHRESGNTLAVFYFQKTNSTQDYLSRSQLFQAWGTKHFVEPEYQDRLRIAKNRQEILISSLVERDAGFYYCELHGKASAPVRINLSRLILVEDKALTVPETSINPGANETVEIRCPLPPVQTILKITKVSSDSKWHWLDENEHIALIWNGQIYNGEGKTVESRVEGDEYVVTAKVDTNSTVRFACLLYDCPSCPPKVQRKYQVHVPLKQLKQGESPQIVKKMMKRAPGKSLTITCPTNDTLHHIQSSTEKIYPPDRGNVEHESTEGELTSSFHIENLSPKDEGEYYCSSNLYYRYNLHIRQHKRHQTTQKT